MEKKIKAEEVVQTLEVLQEVFNIEKFAQSVKTGAFTPMIQNDLMKQLNINVQTGTLKDMQEKLKNPTQNEDELISYGQGYYFSNLMYKRNIEYLVGLPSFDLKISCINANKDDYKKPGYKSDYKEVAKFLDKFNYREQFRQALWNMVNNETYFCMFREFEVKSVLQIFPWKYAQISGKFEYGLLYDIDMSYFLQPQVDLGMFPDWCTKKYKEMFIKGKQNPYNPSDKINKRTGHFGTWAETDPSEGFWCFKMNQNHNIQVPFFSSMLPDMAMLELLKNLQLNQSMAAAQKMIASIIPMIEDKKSSSVANQLAVNPDIIAKFLGYATKGLTDAIKMFAMPAEDIKGIEFENTDKDTYKNFSSITSALLSGGKVMFNPDNKRNIFESQLSLNLDETLMESIYPQFENFLDFYINKRTKKFKFKFTFVGSTDMESRERRREEAIAFADKGMPLPNLIATAMGLNKIELERELEEMGESSIYDKLKLLPNANTMSKDGTQGGRPQKDNSKLSESGEETRNTGSNLGKGGKM